MDSPNDRSDVVVVGSGLAGLSSAFELVHAGRRVLLLESRDVLGGRTSSWVDDGMPVEAGLHKFLGIYRDLPELLERAGASVDDTVFWVDEIAFQDPDVGAAYFTAAPYHRPLRTAWKALTNNHFLSPLEKAKLARLALAGIRDCSSDPAVLDQISIADYARERGISEEIVRRLLFTLTQGVLFLDADRFSAYAVFAPVVEGLKRGLTFRLGAFRGGMTDVMIRPIANAIQGLGGQIRTASAVTRLIVDSDRVIGVEVGSERILADHVVLTAPLHIAQALLREAFGSHPWFQPMLKLETLSAATIQFELDSPIFETDHTNFSPTCLCCFAEQAHTTFRQTNGRLSVILYPPEDFLRLTPEETAERVYVDAERMGIHFRDKVRRYRMVTHPHDFYAMTPGSELLRPVQKTPIPGLTLAGDYTRQPFVASMEGAVISGKRAAEAILAQTARE